MFPLESIAPVIARNHRCSNKLFAFALVLWLTAAGTAAGQSVQRELDTPGKASISITNRNGRVRVIATDDEKKVVVEATSTGAPVEPSDVRTGGKGGAMEIDVRARREQDRIDLTVQVPSRSRIRIISDAGAGNDCLGGQAIALVVCTVHDAAVGVGGADDIVVDIKSAGV